MPEISQPTDLPGILGELRASLPPRGRVFVIPHDYPDPDALTAAAGIELLLRAWNLRAQVVYSGDVARAENRQMLKHFRYRCLNMRKVSRPKNPVPAVLVDTTPWSGNVTLPDFIKVCGVIDHHQVRRKRSVPTPAFVDISPELGATVTRVVELLNMARVPLPRWLATLMTYAVATETLDLSEDFGPRDQAVYTQLLDLTNFRTIGKIRHAPVPRDYYIHLKDAMGQARIYGRICWTHLGRVDHPEILAEMADLLLRMERVSWTFCSAIKGTRILFSLRSSQKGARCGRMLKRVVGSRGSAGGHPRMAAGYVDIEGLSPEQAQQRLASLQCSLVQKIDPRLPEKASLEEISQSLVHAKESQEQKNPS